MAENERTKISTHILPASATLLGLCFVLLSTIKLMGIADKTLIDELAGAATVFFLASSIFSYGSMRALGRAQSFERIADLIFIGGLFFLSIVSLVVVFGVVQ
jgi:hypothetical protein